MDENLHNKDLTEEEFNHLDMDKKILQYSARYRIPYMISKEEALKHLKEKIDSGFQTRTTKRLSRRTYYWIGTVAASIALLIGIWYGWAKRPVFEVAAEKGQHKEYMLPDGSFVTMNADSKILFRKNKFNTERNLKLDGEAFFNVKKGKSFVIHTELADIKILGTTFNVFARNNVFKVSCLTGKISVTSGNQSLIISPGESAEIVSGKLKKFMDKNINSIVNWRIGEFYFENAPISSVFSEIERQFNVKFVVSNKKEQYFTGSFTNNNLVNALDIVCIPMGLTYEIGSNSKVFISEKIH